MIDASAARPVLLAITDRLGPNPVNGAQVIANAILGSLTGWFDVIVVLPEGGAHQPPASLRAFVAAVESLESGSQALDLPPISVIYNFGGTSYSCRVAEHFHRVLGDVPLVNHFEINLEWYGMHRNLGATELEALKMDQARAAHRAARNLFVSHSELALAVDGLGLSGGDNYVVPNPFVPPDRFLPPRERDTFTFLAAGRFSDYVKGADMLYRAFSELLESGASARLRIVSDDARFTSLLSGLPKGSWSLAGWLPRADLLAEMRAADVVVVPSRYEPFGLVALEALAVGTPVIATRVGGLQEIIHHGVTGWLTPPEEGSLGLRRAMSRALSVGRRKITLLGEAGSRAVARDYSLDRIAHLVHLHLDNARRGPEDDDPRGTGGR